MDKPLCSVTFHNGTRCTRGATAITGFCKDCNRWSKSNGGTSPQGRNYKRSNGALRDLVGRAALGLTEECIIVETPSGRRPFCRYNGRQMPMARAVWIEVHGDPGPLEVRHTCNGGSGASGCVNVRHLTLGTHAQNMGDMVDSGRSGKGNGHSQAKLTIEDILYIRDTYVYKARFPHPGSSRAIAMELGLCVQHVTSIVRGARWGHAD